MKTMVGPGRYQDQDEDLGKVGDFVGLWVGLWVFLGEIDVATLMVMIVHVI